MRIRHLLAVLLVLGLGTTGAMAASYTVYPTVETNTTGFTNNVTKSNGEVLVYGGASTGTTRMQTGYFKFDVTSIPDTGFTPSVVQFNFYVNYTYYPYWSVTPVALNPVPIASTAALLWADAQAEKTTGYYNYQNEAGTYAPGWKSLVLGGTAVADLTAALAQNWFVIGAASRDGVATYYLEIDGHTDANVPYLVVSDTPPPANDTCAGAIAIPGTPGTSSYTGDTTFAVNDYDCNAACVGGLAHPGPDVAYSITLPAGCEVCVTLNQSEMAWNGGVYMVTDCANVDGTCVAGAVGWLPLTLDETFCYSDTTTETYYIIVDGRTAGDAGPFQLDVDVTCLAAPSGLTCTDTGSAVNLAWTNNDAYDNVEVYYNGALEATLAGTATTYTVVPDKGYACFYVCGTVVGDSNCSDDCCLIFGYDNVEVLWDFNADDGGFVVDGTGAWQWGAPTFGPCAGTADGNVWATDLTAEYAVNACWLLDSAPITIEMDKGGFLCFDHCYEIEGGYDGGVVWFTTDDYWYYNFEPVGGTDGQITADPGCPWVADRYGFTGDSGGWVTDCWDFTDPMWLGEDVKIRFAFGSDSSVTAAGWMIDNITVYNNVGPEVYSCDYVVTPLSGTVPFSTTHRVSLTNNLVGGQVWTRRLAVKINVVVGNGKSYSNWKSGSTQVAPGNTFIKQFPVTIPALATVIGNNTFTMLTQDVTPAPYNQPPYPASGTTCAKTNVVVAHAP